MEVAQAGEAVPPKWNPCWEPGLPDTPVCLRCIPTGEEPALYGAIARVSPALPGASPAPQPRSPGRRTAAPPPVWYLHLSHICKLLSCPRLVTAEPSATDLAPLIFPPKSILHFPLIIPWLLSELSRCCLGGCSLCLSFWNCSPSDSKWVSQGHSEHLGGGLDFQCCQPWPGGWEPGKNCWHPSLFWKTHSEASDLHPLGVSVLPPPLMWDGSKTLSLLRDLPPPPKKKNFSCLQSTVLTVPPSPPTAPRRWHYWESLEG